MSRADSKKLYLKAFLFGAVIFLIAWSPLLIPAKGAYCTYGDFNYQISYIQQHIHHLWRTGMPLWDYTSDLGMNYFGSYTFYGLASPYMLLTLPFPEAAFPWALTFVTALKFGVACMTACLWCRGFCKTDRAALIGGMLYAFSGIVIFNQCYHFLDIISFFPLLLWSFDRLCERKGVSGFALIMAVSGVTNYYMFFGEMVFLAVYYIVCTIAGRFKISVKQVAKIAVQLILGMGMTAVILLPSYCVLADNSRAGTGIDIKGLLYFPTSGTVLKLLQTLIMPTEMCTNSLLFDNGTIGITNGSPYLPLFSVIGAAAVLRREKRRSWTRLLTGVCVVCAVVPVLNSAFSAFNGTYYARWLFMPSLLLAMLTARYTEDMEDIPIRQELTAGAVIWGIFSAAGIAVMISEGIYKSYYVMLIAVSGAGMGLLGFMRYGGEKGSRLRKKLTLLTAGACVLCLAMPAIYLELVVISPTAESHFQYFSNNNEPVVLEGDPGMRVYMDEFTTVTLTWGYPDDMMFHSLIPGNTSRFFGAAGKYRESNGLLSKEEYAVHSFLSVQYELYCNYPNPGGITIEPEHVINRRKGFTLDSVHGSYIAYRNENYIPMGFTYDYAVDIETVAQTRDSLHKEEEQYSMVLDTSERKLTEDLYGEEQELSINERELLLLKAIWLTPEQMERYKDILPELPEDKRYDFSDEAYEKDCADRRAAAAYCFQPDDRGFTSRIELDHDDLVFFSVPYDDSFTVIVDGQETGLEKVFGGLCAVYVPAGDHEIRFDYAPRGIAAGAIVSAVSAGVWVVYTAVFVFIRRRAKTRRGE